jgi:hypothetical protein
MKSRSLFTIALLSAALAACGDDGGTELPIDSAPIDAPPGTDAETDGVTPMTIDVPAGDITANTTWTAPHTYVLKGQVFVRNSTLTITPGTIVRGENGSALVITNTAKIDAQGTVDQPIVFTSVKATLAATEPAPPQGPAAADWGGVVLLGLAPINIPGGTSLAEGFPTGTDPARIGYGGNDAAHECGKIKYVRIEYAGFKLNANNEINSLTVNGCGSNTLLDYIQLHAGDDDGIEFFGGTANMSHVVITRHDNDDSLDWEFGWVGKAQFVIVQRGNAGTTGERGIEGDNLSTAGGNPDATPRSNPTIWNFTFVGSRDFTMNRGIQFRSRTYAQMSNGILQDFEGGALANNDDATRANWATNNLSVNHTYTFNQDAAVAPPFPVALAADEALFNAVDNNNHPNMNPMLAAPGNFAAPNWKPMDGSPVLTGCGTPPAGFDTTATFCGAIGATDWTLGWTRYPQ